MRVRMRSAAQRTTHEFSLLFFFCDIVRNCSHSSQVSDHARCHRQFSFGHQSRISGRAFFGNVIEVGCAYGQVISEFAQPWHCVHCAKKRNLGGPGMLLGTEAPVGFNFDGLERDPVFGLGHAARQPVMTANGGFATREKHRATPLRLPCHSVTGLHGLECFPSHVCCG